MTDLLVNTIGNYSGTVLFDDGFGGDGSETKTLEIMADGAWKIELLPLESMKSFNDAKTISGTGDSVFYYTGDSGIATVHYAGSSNIAVIKHGLDTDLAVNEIGPYQGTVVLQNGLIEVKAEGAWTIDFK